MEKRAAREECWARRDAFHACMDEHGDRAACAAQWEAYKGACPISWLKHFEKKRQPFLNDAMVQSGDAAYIAAKKEEMRLREQRR